MNNLIFQEGGSINKKFLFFFIITILWICLIFSFSIQSGDKSELVSDNVGNLIIEHSSSEVSDKFESMSVIEWKYFYRLIRKCAHFTEFFVLGIFMIMTLRQIQVEHKKSIGFALCSLVAVMDETIQLFVSGRSGQWTDVLLDSFGGLTGICVSLICIRFFVANPSSSAYNKTNTYRK